jgi:hypothetical protein
MFCSDIGSEVGTFSLELELMVFFSPWARFALLIYYFTGGYAIA